MKAFLLLLCLLLSSCAPHYHVVRLSKGADEKGNIVNYYAVTRNGVIIPEYVIDDRGKYPDTKEEAMKRFKEREHPLDDLVKKKYVLPDNTIYEVKRNTIGAGLLVVSPIVIPLQMLTWSKAEKDSGVTLSRPDYFETAFEEPVPKDPKLKDELAQNI